MTDTHKKADAPDAKRESASAEDEERVIPDSSDAAHWEYRPLEPANPGDGPRSEQVYQGIPEAKD